MAISSETQPKLIMVRQFFLMMLALLVLISITTGISSFSESQIQT